MSYASKLHLVPMKTMHQNYGAPNQTCHHSTAFTGKAMLWQMFHANKNPQHMKLEQNSELQTGRNCNEDAKEKRNIIISSSQLHCSFNRD